MKELNSQEMFDIIGGATSNISTTLLNSISRLITTILDLGRSIGSFIYRYQHNDYCN